MTNYDGSPDWPSIALVDDSTVPSGSNLNVPFESLADRTAWLRSLLETVRDLVSQVQAINFPTHPEQSSVGEMKAAAYDPVYRRWYVVGATENVRASDDWGLSWPASSEIASVAADENCHGLDIDGSGNVVVATSAEFVFSKVASTGVWTKVDLGAWIDPPGVLQVAYDPIHTQWCVAGVNTGAGTFVTLTSANRTSWSASTAPSSFTNMTNLDMRCNKTSGRLVLVGQTTSSNTIKVRTSDDGGETWTSRSDITVGAVPDYVALIRDTNVANRWLLITSRTSGSWNSDVWASTDDGVTFTRICQLAFNALFRCAPVGSMLVGVCQNPTLNRFESVFSLDGGATWHPSGFRLAGTMRGAFPGANGAAIVTSSDIFLSHRAGVPSASVLT